MSDPELEAELEEQVSTALQRLYNWQNPDGGWGWWSNQKSDPLTSAYVVLGLVEAVCRLHRERRRARTMG